LYIGGNIVCNGSDRCSCHQNISNFNCGANKPSASDAIEIPISSILSLGPMTVKRYPLSYDHDITFYWTFEVMSNASADDFYPWNGSAVLEQDSSEAFVTFQPQAALLNSKTSKSYTFKILSCFSDSQQSCEIIYPYSIPIIVSLTNADQQSSIQTYLTELPDWVWYLLLGGIVIAGLGGWLFWIQRKNKYMSSEAENQDQQNIALIPGHGPLDYGGDKVQINPNWNPNAANNNNNSNLRDDEIENRQKNTEKAHVDSDNLVFRQQHF